MFVTKYIRNQTNAFEIINSVRVKYLRAYDNFKCYFSEIKFSSRVLIYAFVITLFVASVSYLPLIHGKFTEIKCRITQVTRDFT